MSENSRPSLLMITGWAHGKEAMQPMADSLSDGYNVEIRTGAQVLSDRIIRNVDYIITGSMGGLLAMELLPESCKKLVLISSTARFCATTEYKCGTHEKILKRMIVQLKRNPEAVLEEFFKNVHFPHKESRQSLQLRSGCLSDSTSQTELEAPSTLDALAAGLEYLLSADVRDIVPHIKVPVLLLHGAEDRIIPPSASEWLHAHLPHSSLQVFENEGHALPAHRFNEVVEKIDRFL